MQPPLQTAKKETLRFFWSPFFSVCTTTCLSPFRSSRKKASSLVVFALLVVSDYLVVGVENQNLLYYMAIEMQSLWCVAFCIRSRLKQQGIQCIPTRHHHRGKSIQILAKVHTKGSLGIVWLVKVFCKKTYLGPTFTFHFGWFEGQQSNLDNY